MKIISANYLMRRMKEKFFFKKKRKWQALFSIGIVGKFSCYFIPKFCREYTFMYTLIINYWFPCSEQREDYHINRLLKYSNERCLQFEGIMNRNKVILSKILWRKVLSTLEIEILIWIGSRLWCLCESHEQTTEADFLTLSYTSSISQTLRVWCSLQWMGWKFRGTASYQFGRHIHPASLTVSTIIENDVYQGWGSALTCFQEHPEEEGYGQGQLWFPILLITIRIQKGLILQLWFSILQGPIIK